MLDRIQAQACYQGKDYIDYLIPFQENVEELKRLYFTLTQIENDKYKIAWGGY